MQRRDHRINKFVEMIAVIVGFVVVLCLVYVVSNWFITGPGGDRAPGCAGLQCYDTSDCGRSCTCERAPGAALGRCAATRP